MKVIVQSFVQKKKVKNLVNIFILLDIINPINIAGKYKLYVKTSKYANMHSSSLDTESPDRERKIKNKKFNRKSDDYLPEKLKTSDHPNYKAYTETDGKK